MAPKLSGQKVDDPGRYERQFYIHVEDRPEEALRGADLLEDVAPHYVHSRHALLHRGDRRAVFGEWGGARGGLQWDHVFNKQVLTPAKDEAHCLASDSGQRENLSLSGVHFSSVDGWIHCSFFRSVKNRCFSMSK